MKYLYAEHVFGWDAEQVRASRQFADRVADVGLVGLLHQFRWRCASAPYSYTYAM